MFSIRSLCRVVFETGGCPCFPLGLSVEWCLGLARSWPPLGPCVEWCFRLGWSYFPLGLCVDAGTIDRFNQAFQYQLEIFFKKLDKNNR